MHPGKVLVTVRGYCYKTASEALALSFSLTFFCKLLVYDELPVSEVVQYWTKICGVSIDEIRPCLILLSEYRNEVGMVNWYQQKNYFSRKQ